MFKKGSYNVKKASDKNESKEKKSSTEPKMTTNPNMTLKKKSKKERTLCRAKNDIKEKSRNQKR